MASLARWRKLGDVAASRIAAFYIAKPDRLFRIHSNAASLHSSPSFSTTHKENELNPSSSAGQDASSSPSPRPRRKPGKQPNLVDELDQSWNFRASSKCPACSTNLTLTFSSSLPVYISGSLQQGIWKSSSSSSSSPKVNETMCSCPNCGTNWSLPVPCSVVNRNPKGGYSSKHDLLAGLYNAEAVEASRSRLVLPFHPTPTWFEHSSQLVVVAALDLVDRMVPRMVGVDLTLARICLHPSRSAKRWTSM